MMFLRLYIFSVMVFSVAAVFALLDPATDLNAILLQKFCISYSVGSAFGVSLGMLATGKV
ncbi:MAG: hypothetical protein ACRCXZ_02345 [Patescibacteria group bacterium]